jgi:hypothetical protein
MWIDVDVENGSSPGQREDILTVCGNYQNVSVARQYSWVGWRKKK